MFGVTLSGWKELGLCKRGERVLANLASEERDVGPERRMGDDAEPGDSVLELADLDLEVEVGTVRDLRGRLERDASRVAQTCAEPYRSWTVTSRRGSSTERFTSVVDTIFVLGTKIFRPSSVESAV